MAVAELEAVKFTVFADNNMYTNHLTVADTKTGRDHVFDFARQIGTMLKQKEMSVIEPGGRVTKVMIDLDAQPGC